MKEKLFFSSYDRTSYTTTNTYYQVEEIEWAKLLENNWQVMREEVDVFVKNNPHVIKQYFATNMMSRLNSWQVAGFYFWGAVNKKIIGKCPITIAVLDKIPGVVSASVSIMKPHTEIKGHKGDTNAIYRCHIPLHIPGKLPEVGFQVEEEMRSWEEGKILIFNDAAYHKAWNFTDQDRVILIVDVIKPEYIHLKRWICSKVLGSLVVQFFSQKIRFLKRKSIFRNYLNYFFAILIWIYFFLFGRKLFKN